MLEGSVLEGKGERGEAYIAKGRKDIIGFFFYQALSMYNSETVGTLPAQTELMCQP